MSVYFFTFDFAFFSDELITVINGKVLYARNVLCFQGVHFLCKMRDSKVRTRVVAQHVDQIISAFSSCKLILPFQPWHESDPRTTLHELKITVVFTLTSIIIYQYFRGTETSFFLHFIKICSRIVYLMA